MKHWLILIGTILYVEEIESINDNDIWVFINLPPNVVLIKTKWVFKAKTRVNGVVKKLKAILVAKGCQQTSGINYDGIFSLVVKWNSICLVVTMLISRSREIFHLDVDSTFL